MKIAIINSNLALEAGGGVRMQGIMWHDGIVRLGHECDLINFWDENNWGNYDWIIVLAYGEMFPNIMRQLPKFNPNIAIAPIIDPRWSKNVFKFFFKYWGFKKHFGLSSQYHDFYLYGRNAKLYLTRSNLETEFLSDGCDVSLDIIHKVPLSLRFNIADEMPEKENFCFHCSRLRAANKNVERLISAAKKYHFKLKLAGTLNGENEKQWLSSLIENADNIEYVGMLSDEQLISYYRRAKVFALPSLVEGVGMVALEAAAYGAEVVLTNIGAPKEYWDGHAELVNPYDVDDIGNAVVKCLNKKTEDSDILEFMKAHYSLEACTHRLIEVLKNN